MKQLGSPVSVADTLLELRQTLVREAIDLLTALEGTNCPDSAMRLGLHASVHRLAGGLGFFGLTELGATAQKLDLRMSDSSDDWTVSEIVELLSTIERSLRP
jgi:HPt (histidine-containing phosphotransfer) domain-containing protein